MRVSQEISLPGRITSVDLSPSGERMAVVADDRDAHYARIFRRGGGSADAAFAPEKVLPLVVPQRPADAEEDEGEAALTAHLRAAFLGEAALVVQGELGYRDMIAFAVDLGNGARTGEFRAESTLLGVVGPPPLAISPRHVLVQTLDNVLCLEAPSLREVFRIRHYDEEGGVLGEDDLDDCDEQVAGVAFDPETSTLHVLWGMFNSGSLTRYHLDPGKGECRRAYRRGEVCTDVPAGLCLTPGGHGGLTGVTLTLDAIAPLPEGSATSETPPRYAPLGFLCLWKGDDDRQTASTIELRSALLRDFYWGFHHAPAAEEGGEPKVTGVRVSALEPVGAAPPFYTGPTRAVVPTPGGFLIGIDTGAAEGGAGAEAERLDLGAPLAAACWHAASRTVVAGCEEGRLVVVAA